LRSNCKDQKTVAVDSVVVVDDVVVVVCGFYYFLGRFGKYRVRRQFSC